ncbi:MAG: hypothetical protein MRY21_02115 [Simkaniaceae bacterium]|nr:hypothetical protein [Simkaniaceae bacterium]
MAWQLIDTGVNSAEKNMEIDDELLNRLDPNGPAILHFYDWQVKCGTYGYFIKPEKFLDLDCARELGIELARRPTGGGIVFHIWDLAFSVLIPAGHEGYHKRTLDNYDYVNHKVKRALHALIPEGTLGLLPAEPIPLDESSRNFCMAKPTKYDVMVGDVKVAGAAQRSKAQGYLHQGTISLARPDKDLLDALLLPGSRVNEAMGRNTFYLLEDLKHLDEMRNQVKESLKQAIMS